MVDVSHPGIDSPPTPREPVERCSPGPTNRFVPFLPAEIEHSIPERFEQQAALYPDRIAVDGLASSLTYDALNRWANQVARAILARRSGEQGKTLGLLLQKDAPMLAALMGALKAGQIYVALDPAHPRERASRMLEDAGETSFLLTMPTLRRLASWDLPSAVC